MQGRGVHTCVCMCVRVCVELAYVMLGPAVPKPVGQVTQLRNQEPRLPSGGGGLVSLCPYGARLPG